MDLFSSLASVSCDSGTNAWTITGTISLDGVGPGAKIYVGSRTASTPAAILPFFRIATIDRVAKTFTTTDNATTNYAGVPFFIDYDGSGINFLPGMLQTVLNRLDTMFGIGSTIFAGGGSRFMLARQTGASAIAELMFSVRSGDTHTAAFFLRQRQVSGVEVLDFISTTDGTTEVVVFRITRAGVVSFPSSLSTSALQAESLNSGPLGGMRNQILNGGFDVWQRGASSFSLPGYTADRWYADFCTDVQRSTDVPDSRFTYSIEFGNSAASFPLIRQQLEPFNVRHLFNRKARFSLWAKNVSGADPLVLYTTYASAYENFGTLVDHVYSAAITSPSSSWTRYSLDLGTVAANIANGYRVQIFRTNGAAATTRVTGVQLEIGDVPTAYEYAGDRGGVGNEMLRSMRHFEAGSFRSENGSRWIAFKARKRATPTVAVSAGTAGNITVDGFEHSHSSSADITFTATADL